MSKKKLPTDLIDLRAKNEVAFFEKARNIHGNKFDYSHFKYVNAKTRSTLVCTQHGNFEQTPDKHLNTTTPCPGCWHERRILLSKKRNHNPNPSIRITAEEYLRRLALPAHITADMSNYQGMTLGTVTVECDKHGPSTHQPNFLLRVECRCPRCGYEKARRSMTKSFENFIEAVRQVHGDKYSIPYPEEYANRKSILTIVCQKHGTFSKKGQKLLAGQGCFPCRMEELVLDGTLSGGYNNGFFERHPELVAAPAIVYYLKVGDVYKVGITRDKLKRRLTSLRFSAKQEPILLDQHACALQEAYTLEQTILQDFRLSRTWETWSSEVFREDVLRETSLADYAAAVFGDAL